jgi:hypothetical protein
MRGHVLAAAVALALALRVPCAHAADEPSPRGWYDVMQAADAAAAHALYAATADDPAAPRRADADRARVRGRAVELGRAIRMSDTETRHQVRTSDGALLLLTWRRPAAGWRVAEVQDLADALYDRARPGTVWWPDTQTSEGPRDVVLRLARSLRAGALSEAAIRKDFLVPGSRPTDLGALVSSIAAASDVPVLRGQDDGKDLWKGAVEVPDAAFDFEMKKVADGWRISAATAKRTTRVVQAALTAEDVVSIMQLLDRMESSIASGDAGFLLGDGVDGRGAKPADFTKDTATDVLTEWRARFGRVRVAWQSKDWNLSRDLIGSPAGDRLLLPITDGAGPVHASVWLARIGGAWKVVDLISHGGQTTLVPATVPQPKKPQ